MSTFDDRKDSFERKFSHDAEMMFKIEARAVKLLGLWLAEEKFSLSGAEADAYAGSLITANLEEPGIDDVKRKVQADLSEKGLEYDEGEIDVKFESFAEQAAASLSKD